MSIFILMNLFLFFNSKIIRTFEIVVATISVLKEIINNSQWSTAK